MYMISILWISFWCAHLLLSTLKEEDNTERESLITFFEWVCFWDLNGPMAYWWKDLNNINLIMKLFIFKDFETLIFINKRLTLRSHEAKTLEKSLFSDTLHFFRTFNRAHTGWQILVCWTETWSKTIGLTYSCL